MRKEHMFPADRKLGESERLRLFKADKGLLKEVARELGVEEDEAKRRGVHVGLRELAEMLGIDVEDEAPKKAA